MKDWYTEKRVSRSIFGSILEYEYQDQRLFRRAKRHALWHADTESGAEGSADF